MGEMSYMPPTLLGMVLIQKQVEQGTACDPQLGE